MEKEFWEEAYREIKEGSNRYKIIGKGSNRVTYDLQNGFVIKIPKKEKIEKATKQSHKEYEIWGNAPESIKKHLVPVYHIIDDSVIMKKASPLVNDDSVEKVEMNEEVRKVIQYLSSVYDLEEYEISFACNWAILDNVYVLIDYGR